MCLVFDARPSTKDVDAVFKPAGEIRASAEQISREFGIRRDWLNDAVKGFLVEHPSTLFFDWPNLKVYHPEPDYLLAMKALASRVDTADAGDIRFLIKKLSIKSPAALFDLIESYYPKNRIKPATQFFIEELFDDDERKGT